MYVALLLATAAAAQVPQPITRAEDLLVTNNAPGKYGGRIVVALRAEPKSLNPATSLDQPSREVVGRMMADLLHINAVSQQAEPALAKSWKASKDGLLYTLTLRRGLRFSDGQPMNADDVLFTFQVLLDEKINSPQRDLLTIGGKPISVRKVDDATVVFELARPYAAAERLFDSMEILPRHLLQDAYRQGTLARAWGLTTPPSQIAGMGPFRLKEYQPGQKLVLERNPYYWKADRNHHSALQKDAASRNFHLFDLGPSLDYNFLVFNLNATVPKDATDIARHQEWFRNVNFRQAVSTAVDRAAIVRLVFHGRGTALWSSTTPANKLWLDASLSQTPRSLEHAKQLLRNGGFSWNAAGALLDKSGAPVEFSILTSASNAQRTQMATLIQDDLRQLGMKVQAVPLEFKSMLDRVFQTHNYDTAIMALGGGDVDPNSQINVWMSNGGSHLWNLGESKPATDWEAKIDALMNQQLTTLDYKRRKQLYDQVQEIAAQQLPFINLASPNVLVGAKERIGNFQPAILDHYTLWNVEQLYVK